jgi:hypothetical protein
LTRHSGRLHDGANTFPVDRPTFTGAVEIDKMQIGSARRNPTLGHRGRLGAEDGFLRIIALSKADTLAAAQVDSGIDQHSLASFRRQANILF